MTSEAQWLIEYTDEGGVRACETYIELSAAIDAMENRAHLGRDPALWQRPTFAVTFSAPATQQSPKKKRAQRKRRDSTGTATPDGSTPGQSSAAAAPVDVRPPAAAAPVAPPAPTPGPARPTCGGKTCEVKGDKEIHRLDPSCSKLMANRKGAAAR